MEIRVLEYVTDDGEVPFSKWLSSLRDRQATRRIRTRLNRVRLGNLGDHKSLGGGVFELRLPYGPGYRVYFGREGNTLVLLLCGGDKSTQSKDIAIARQHWEAYRSEQNGDT
ncbi:MAG: type II toxin-antitoxin system RelE/ParE family toxin [Magnetococcales bacterium]|nr:type II toxin-antitoxin system RelE/ParE family toxin [Magnetococcales bacterium]